MNASELQWVKLGPWIYWVWCETVVVGESGKSPVREKKKQFQLWICMNHHYCDLRKTVQISICLAFSVRVGRHNSYWRDRYCFMVEKLTLKKTANSTFSTSFHSNRQSTDDFLSISDSGVHTMNKTESGQQRSKAYVSRMSFVCAMIMKDA